MKTPLFRNHNDGRVYDANNRTMFFVNDPTTAEEIIKIINDNAALRSELEAVKASEQKMREALQKIAYDSHCNLSGSEYNIGVADGHRCAAQVARNVIAALKGGKG